MSRSRKKCFSECGTPINLWGPVRPNSPQSGPGTRAKSDKADAHLSHSFTPITIHYDNCWGSGLCSSGVVQMAFLTIFARGLCCAARRRLRLQCSQRSTRLSGTQTRPASSRRLPATMNDDEYEWVMSYKPPAIHNITSNMVGDHLQS